MEVLVTEFKSLCDIQDFVPCRQSPHPVKKLVVVQMKILFKDEKKSDTIDILTQLAKDSGGN